MNNSEIIEATLKLLGLDPDFVVKDKTVKGVALTALDVIKLIVEDAGESKIIEVLKGHDQIKIRQVLSHMFFDLPKPSVATPWFAHILRLNNLKKCPNCATIKNTSEFSKNSAQKVSGLDSWCLPCMKINRNSNLEHLKLVKQEWQQLNKDKVCASSARRRAVKANALVAWSSNSAIEWVYASCPEGYHVDHWAPLQGELVCGLHTEDNLQYLPANINISKSNKFDDAYPYREYGPYC